MNAAQRRKFERRLTRHFKPMADAIDSLAAGVEEGIVSTKELREIAQELRRIRAPKEKSDE